MNANRRRGEMAAELDGKPYRLCLTLGALAELEAVYAADDLGALVQRFSTGRLSALDMTRLIGAGLRGGGSDLSDGDVARMQAAGGAAGFAAIVTDLLTPRSAGRRRSQTLRRRGWQSRRISVGQHAGRGVRPAAAFPARFLVNDAARVRACVERPSRTLRRGAEAD